MKINDEGTSNAAHWYERAMKAEARLAEAERDTTWQGSRRLLAERCLKAEALLRRHGTTLQTRRLPMFAWDRIDAFLTTNSRRS